MADISDVFHIPASKKNEPENKFHFSFPGSSKRYSLPLLKYVKPSVVTDMGAMSEGEFMLKFVSDYLPEAFEKFDDVEQLEALFAAWGAKSGVSLGESSASPKP